MTDSKLKIVLVDDHAVVRTGYRLLLENDPNLEVIAELQSGEEANQQIQALQPDVLVTDLSMPGIGGLEAIRRIKLKLPKLKILVFTMHDNAAFLEHALDAGANGYITKNSAPNVLVEAVRTIARGERYIDASLQDRLSRQKGSDENDEHKAFANLSKREFQIFCKFAEGQSVNQVAEDLSISPKTVANYQTQIKEKLGLHSSADLIKLAISKGIIDMEV